MNLQYRDSSVDIEDSVVENLIENISTKYNVPIRFENITNGANAYYSLEKDEIVLSVKLQSNAHKISSLFHELGHKIMHSDIPYDEIHKNKGLIEGEAESFSKVLSNLYGIQNNSELYISTWGNSGEDLRDRLEKISTTAVDAIRTLGLDLLQKSITEVSYTQSSNIPKDTQELNAVERAAKLAKIDTNTAVVNVKPIKSKGYSDVAI